jgi:putative ABC transport system substrate-binding protein
MGIPGASNAVTICERARERKPRTLSAMKRALAVVLLLAIPLVSHGQPAKKRVGFLSPGERASHAFHEATFTQAMRDLGWRDGENLTIAYRFGGEKYERLRALADDLVRLQVDVIYAASAPAAQAAKDATTTLPIVFSMPQDPVRAGLVASLARPGGNLTGQAGLGPELDRKRLEMLKDIVPSLTYATILANPTNPGTPQRLTEIEATARALKLQLRVLNAADRKALDAAFETMARARPAGLLVLSDSTLIENGGRIIDFAREHRIPAVYTSPGWAELGGLIEYTPDFAAVIRGAAAHVDRILRGAKPGDLPVEQPRKFQLAINMRTAKALGLTIPPSLRAAADQVIE